MMFKKTLVSAFAAVALTGMMTALAPAMADTPQQTPSVPTTQPTTQSVTPAPASQPLSSQPTSLLRVGGSALPVTLAGRLLAREGWAPIAAGVTQDGQLVVLRKQDSDTVRVVDVTHGTLRVIEEGVASNFSQPGGPFTLASLRGVTLHPVQTVAATKAAPTINAPADDTGPAAQATASGLPQGCMDNLEDLEGKLLSAYGEMPVMTIKTNDSTFEFTTGLNGPDSWTLIRTQDGQAMTCMVDSGVKFKVSDIFPHAHWAAPQQSVAQAATPAVTAPAP